MFWSIQLSTCPPLQGDGLHRVNGDLGGLDSSPGGHGRVSPTDFQPSPSLHSPSAADTSSLGINPHATSEGQSLKLAEAGGHRGGTEAAKEEVREHWTPPSRPTSLPGVSRQSAALLLDTKPVPVHRSIDVEVSLQSETDLVC